VKKKHSISLLILLILVLASCAPLQPEQQSKELPLSEPVVSNPDDVSSPPLSDAPSQETNAEGTSIPPAESNLRDLTEKAKNDLVSQFGYAADQIKVLGARTVTWPDASLGCPQQDLQYAQVLTPGFWILLEADSKQYPYHTDQVNQLVLCMDDLSPNAEGTPLPLIPVKPDDIKDGDPLVPVN